MSLDNADATLTMRPHRGADGIEVPRAEWAFGRWENEKLIPDATHVYVKAGLRPGWLYDLVYMAKEPRVTGLGLTAMRDCVAFFRHGEAKTNPLAGAVQKACVFGISQSGRVIHHFLYEGLNGDEQDRIVFDGALIHVAGSGKGMFNHRFRMSTEYGTQHEGHLSGSEFFPLAPLPQTDPVTGESGDSLARSRKSGHTPCILFTQTSTEYWSRAASLLHTDVEGNTDLTLPDDVRVFSWPVRSISAKATALPASASSRATRLMIAVPSCVPCSCISSSGFKTAKHRPRAVTRVSPIKRS